MPQTTSVSTAAGGVVYWRGGSLPSGAGAVTMWARVADWSGGITLQEFLGVRISGGNTAKCRLNRSSGNIEVNESAGSATTLVSGSDTAWAFYAFRLSGGVWEVIHSPTGSSSLNKTTLSTLSSGSFDEIVVFQADNVFDVRGATVRLLDGTVTDSDLLTLKASDAELSPGSSTSVGFWPFDDHTTVTVDQSSTAVNLGQYWATSAPTTVSDTPYGAAPITGDSATTQGDNTVSASGTVAVVGTSATTQGDTTVAAAGAVAVVGASATTQGANTVTSAATVLVSGALASTQGDNTLSSTGTVESNDRYAESSTTQGDNAVSATGTVLIRGASATTQGDNTVSVSDAPLDDLTPAVGRFGALSVAVGRFTPSPVAVGTFL